MRTRIRQRVSAPVYNGCMAWYNVLLIPPRIIQAWIGIQSIWVYVKIPLYSSFIVTAIFFHV